MKATVQWKFILYYTLKMSLTLTDGKMTGWSLVEVMSSFWQGMSQWTTPCPLLKLQPVKQQGKTFFTYIQCARIWNMLVSTAHLVPKECSSFAVVFLLQCPIRIIILLEFKKQAEFSISSCFHLLKLNIFPLVHGDRAYKTAGRYINQS